MIRRSGPLALAFVALLAGQPWLAGQASAQIETGTFERRDDCIAAGSLTAQECDFAYGNARAEFLQKAPRYASRGLCERSHGRCAAQLVSTSGGWESLGQGGATYVPRFAGIRIVGAGAARKVFPVALGKGRIVFAGRSVTARQDEIGGRRTVTGEGRGASRHANARSGGRANSGGGDRDDTVRENLKQEPIGADVAPGLYIDPDGVEWYKPRR